MTHVDDNSALYQRIRSGDKTAIDEMILGNLPLVENRLRLFLKEYRRFSHLRDDLYGEAILALTKTVNSFAECEADKPTSYIVSAIDHELKNSVDSELGAGMMSRSSVQHRRSRDQPLPQKLPIDAADPPAALWRNASGRVQPKQIDSNAENDSFGRPSKVSHADAAEVIARHEQDDATCDLLDTILACCESEQDETIVRLRIQG